MNSIENTPFSSIRQLGMVVRNLDDFINDMKSIYGLNPDRTAFYPKESDYETCQRRIAFYNFPEVEIEVVEPTRSMPYWHEFLEKHGNCLQHIQFNVTSLKDAISRMEAMGATILERGYSITDPRVEFVFFDTVDKLGYVTEVVNFKEFQ